MFTPLAGSLPFICLSHSSNTNTFQHFTGEFSIRVRLWTLNSHNGMYSPFVLKNRYTRLLLRTLPF